MPRGKKRKFDLDDFDKMKTTSAKKLDCGKSSQSVNYSFVEHDLVESPKKKMLKIKECSVRLDKLPSSSPKIPKSKNKSILKRKQKKKDIDSSSDNSDSDLVIPPELSVEMKMAMFKYSSTKKTLNKSVVSVRNSSPKKSSEDVTEKEIATTKSQRKKKIGESELKDIASKEKERKAACVAKAKTPLKKKKLSKEIVEKTPLKKKKLSTEIVEKTPAGKKKKAEISLQVESKKKLVITNANIVKAEKIKTPAKTERNSDTSESESDWEEVKEEDYDEGDQLENYNPEIPKEGVQITLEGPKIVKRRKKKSWDQLEAIRLYINRERKELQMNKHKTHLLCLIVHGMRVNNILNEPQVYAFALSVVPPEFLALSKKSAKIDLEAIQKLFKWFCGEFTVPEKYKFYHISVHKLCKCFEQRKASNIQEYNMLFVIIARTLGLSVRLCASLYPASFKARNLLKKPKTKENDENVEANLAEKLMQAKLKKLFNDDEKSQLSAIESLDVNLKEEDESNDGQQKKGKKSIKDSNVSKKSPKSEKKQNMVEKPSKKEIASVKVKNDGKREVRTSKNEPSKSPSSRPRRSVGKKVYKMSSGESDIDDSGDEFQDQMKNKVEQKTIVATSRNKKSEKHKTATSKSPKGNRKVLSSDSESSECDSKNSQTPGVEYWLEIYCKVTKKWVSVECFHKIVNKPYEIEKVVTHPISYVLAFDNSSFVKDTTKRYCVNFLTETRKLRPDIEWWEESLLPFMPPNTKEDREEESQMEATLLTKPLPKTIGEYKNHPLYALKRHLLKFEALYPPDVEPLGFIRGEPVYSREAVRTLHSRENWVKEARMVRVGEEPYKIVKARPKWDRFAGVMKTDLPLEIFGYWQTEEYIPPIAHNGKVPRNEYGNVELFKPCMLPIGTVHLQFPGINTVAKKLGIDCATAVIGFDAHKGNMCPVYDGYVICEEFQDVVMDAWNEEQDLKLKREEEKREKRIYGNWRKLIRGLLIREKIKIKYAVG